MYRLTIAFVTTSALTACSGDDEVTIDPPPPPIIEVVDTSAAATIIKVEWSAGVEGKTLHVRDAAGNDFSSSTKLDADRVDARFRLPPGRAFTVEAAYLGAGGSGRVLATASFTTKVDTVCDRTTTQRNYSAQITAPTAGSTLPAGLAPRSAFVFSHTPTNIPDRYLYVIDETTKENLPSATGFQLLPGRAYTMEVGWFCLEDIPERVIPLAAVRFSTPP